MSDGRTTLPCLLHPASEMKTARVAATLALLALTSLPLTAQESHHRAKRQQTRSDHRHHTGAKIVGGSAAGGAVVGGLLGGGKGALIGAGVGAAGGAVANKHRENKDIRQRESGQR